MNTGIAHLKEEILMIEDTLKKTIIGQDEIIHKLMIALIAGGHVLLEGVPGLGKTKIIKTLAEVLGYDTKRISFTPDLMPSDLTGIEMYRPQTGEFEVRKGPIFTEILLADEINRTPPKVQSALLEAMEERHVTIGNMTYPLSERFFVVATENPLEHEGTYPLPEAQLDRFFMKLIISYPEINAEKAIIQSHTQINKKKNRKTEKQINIKKIHDSLTEAIRADEHIFTYISSLLEASRGHGKWVGSTLSKAISSGGSTRAGIALLEGARVVAFLDGRDYILPDDVKYVAPDILRHRIIRSYEALSRSITTDDIIRELLESVAIPS